MVLGTLHHLQALGFLDPEEAALDAVLFAAAVAGFPSPSTPKTLGREGEQVRAIVADLFSYSDTGRLPVP